MSRLVDEYVEGARSLTDSVRFLTETPVLCDEITQAIKRKVYSHVQGEPAAAIRLLDTLMDQPDMLAFHQAVHEKSYLSFIEKVITRKSDDLNLINLLKKWVQKFDKDSDIFPNFALCYSRLVEQGFAQSIAPSEAAPTNEVVVMDQYLLNEAEGQDPEEFKQEVAQTIKLFTDVFNTIVTDNDENEDRREALISLAANLDRYSEQFGLWIEQLDPGQYMEEAMHLNDQVTDALQKYKLLRSGALDKKDDSDDSSSDSDSS